MREKNVMALEYLSDEERFADYVNVLYFNGEQVIHPEDIQEQSSHVLRIRRWWGRLKTDETMRDLLCRVVTGTQYIIVGIEHQSAVDRTMPVRIMGYDAAEYEKQLRKIKRRHRRKRDLKNADYINGFSAEDRLTPVLTSVLYFGEEEWQGPRDLHGILDLDGKLACLKEYVPNYKINVIEVWRFQDWKKFKSDLRYVFGYIQNSKSHESIRQFIQTYAEKFSNLPEDLYDFIQVMTNADELLEVKQKIKNEEGGFDMCQGIQEWLMIERGAGRAEGELLGEARGEAKNTINIIRRKLEQGLTPEAIAYWLELDEEYVQTVAQWHKKNPKGNDSELAAQLLQ